MSYARPARWSDASGRGGASSNTTRARPARLAAYRAASARANHSSAGSLPRCSATPTLTVTLATEPTSELLPTTGVLPTIGATSTETPSPSPTVGGTPGLTGTPTTTGTPDLTGTPIDVACGVIGGLLRRLHVAALPQAPALADFVVHELGLLRSRPDVLPRRYLEQVTALVRDLLGDPASGATLLHADLHFRNVLAGDREPWLAIDPKPMSGHPGFEVHPVLRNRVDELRAAPRMRQAIRRRFEILCESAGLDEDAARDWTVCLLYTSPSPRDRTRSRMPSSA